MALYGYEFPTFTSLIDDTGVINAAVRKVNKIFETILMNPAGVYLTLICFSGSGLFR